MAALIESLDVDDLPGPADQLAVGMARNCGGWQLDGGGIMD